RKGRVHIGALSERRHRRSNEPFRKSFLIDVGNIKSLEPAGPIRSVEIFSPEDHVLDVFTGMFVGFVELSAASDMLLIILRVGDGMEMTSDHGLRFVCFSPDNRM